MELDILWEIPSLDDFGDGARAKVINQLAKQQSKGFGFFDEYQKSKSG